MISEKSLNTINTSPYKEVYEMFFEIEHTEHSYKRVCQVCQFMNETDARMDIDIVNEIFSDYLSQVQKGGSGYGYGCGSHRNS